MKHAWPMVLLLTLPLLGCFPAKLQHLRAYHLYRQGDLQQSLLEYYRLAKNSPSSQLLLYNIGTIYLSLGEPSAALKWWERISEPVTQQLRATLYYNRGVAAYDVGDLPQARDHFVASLRLAPHDLSSKINLELVLRALERSSIQAAPTPDGLEQLDVQRLLDFVKREESWLQLEPSPSGELQEDW